MNIHLKVQSKFVSLMSLEEASVDALRTHAESFVQIMLDDETVLGSYLIAGESVSKKPSESAIPFLAFQKILRFVCRESVQFRSLRCAINDSLQPEITAYKQLKAPEYESRAFTCEVEHFDTLTLHHWASEELLQKLLLDSQNAYRRVSTNMTLHFPDEFVSNWEEMDDILKERCLYHTSTFWITQKRAQMLRQVLQSMPMSEETVRLFSSAAKLMVAYRLKSPEVCSA